MEAIHYEDSQAVIRAPRLLLPHLPVSLCHTANQNRVLVEQFIAARFRQSYQAELKHFLPYILTAQREGIVRAAVGFQPGSTDNKLFVEHYCDSPIEKVLAQLTGKQVGRSKIVEVGNLAGNQGGASLTLFVVMIALLQRAGFEWLVFTATEKLRKMLAKLSFQWMPVTRASEHRLPEQYRGWGSYYQNDPHVVVADITQTAELIRRFDVVPFLLSNYQASIQRCLAGMTQ